MTDVRTPNDYLLEEIEQLRRALTEANALYSAVEAINLDLTERIEAMQADAKLSDMAWKDNQAALKAQAETIARLEAELAQCKHALDDEGEVCECGHTRDEHNYDSIDGCAHVDDCDFCPCMNYEAAKSEQVEDMCECGHSLDSHTKSGVHPCKECECMMFWAKVTK